MPINEQLATQRELFLKVIWEYHGTWYRWAGDDPSSFDCSGLTIEGLQSVGVLPDGFDTNAHGLFHMFLRYCVPDPVRGALVFWKRPGGDRIIHVEICLDGHYAIGARGGGSNVTNEAIAIKQNAFVKVRPIFGRPWPHELAGFTDLFTHPDITEPLGTGGGG